jgi:hypothetical protein
LNELARERQAIGVRGEPRLTARAQRDKRCTSLIQMQRAVGDAVANPAGRDVRQIGVKLTTLSAEQAAHLGVDANGPYKAEHYASRSIYGSSIKTKRVPRGTRLVFR